MNNSTSWLGTITTDSARTVAKVTGLSHTTISRSTNMDTPPPAVVVTVARAYGHNPVAVLVRTGLLTDSETQAFTGQRPLSEYPARVLLQELLRREVEGME